MRPTTALDVMTRGLMIEWARHNVQVDSICPTVIMTPMGREVRGPGKRSEAFLARTPAGRFGEPIEVADLALYLASPASALVNGESVMIEGGFSFVCARARRTAAASQPSVSSSRPISRSTSSSVL